MARWLVNSLRADSDGAVSRLSTHSAVPPALSAPLVLTLQKWQGWRWTFLEFGLLGAVWALVWYRWFRDRPEDHPEVNAAEVALIRSGAADAKPAQHSHQVPWQALFTSRNLATICAMYFAYAYGLYFYITWLPTYLLEARGFSINSTKWLASLPWVVSAFAVAGSAEYALGLERPELSLAYGYGSFGSHRALALFRPDGSEPGTYAGVELRTRFAENFGIAAFLDAGTVATSVFPSFEETVLFGAGPSLRYFTPIGPLRLDLGFPLNPRHGVDAPYQVYFSIGQSF